MWREWIKSQGIRKVSSDLGMSYENTRCWALGLKLPEGKSLRKLVALAHGALSSLEFDLFLNSLAKDIMGVDLTSPHAVNE